MSSLFRALRKRSAPLAGAGAVLLLGVLTLPREMPAIDRARYEQAFDFDRTELVPGIDGLTRDLRVRAVHPSLDRISAWISTLGASIALGDLDGDGLSNDYCLVDTRANAVIVAPVPGTEDRFEPFVLEKWEAGPIAPSGVQFGDFNEDGQTDLLVQYWGRPPRAHLRKRLSGQVSIEGPGFPTERGLAGANTLAARQLRPPLGAVSGLRASSPSADQYLPCDLGLPQPGWHTPESNPAARWYTNALVQADVDGDGHLDLVVGNYFQDGAAILDAQGTEPQSMHAGKAKAFNGGTKHFLLWKSAALGDRPDVTYVDAASNLPPELAHGWTLALGAIDLDGDLLPELYLGNDFGPDQLLHNRSTPGNLSFVPLHGRRDWNTPKSCVLGFDSFKGMGVDFGDLNGDGLMDIYVSNIATPYGLEESHFLWLSQGTKLEFTAAISRGEAPYRQASEELGLSRSGWGWDCRLADFNNDGRLEAIQATGFLKGKVNRWPELQALGTANSELVSNPRFWPKFQPGADLSGHNPTPFFVQANDGRFYNIGPALNLEDPADPMVTRGIAIADVDADGRLDFACANQWEASYFFRNRSPAGPQAFLGISAVLDPAVSEPELGAFPVSRHPGQRPAIGAQLTVRTSDGSRPERVRELIGLVDGGTGHSGRRSPDVHFGLGDFPGNGTLELDVMWRSRDGRVNRRTLKLAKTGWHQLRLPAGGEVK